MSLQNRFHKRYIDESYLEEKSKGTYNPWAVLVEEAIIQEKEVLEESSFLQVLEEGKMQDVSSDDEPDGLDQATPKETPEEETPEEEPEVQPKAAPVQGQEDHQEEEGIEEPLLSQEELQQLIEGFQSGEVTEETLKELLDTGKINNTDIQMLQEQLPSPEEEQDAQINQVQEMVIRFNIYDKIMGLDTKLEIFIENFHEVDSEFFRDVVQVHEFIKVLNTLIFSLEINLVYQMYASLELQLIQLFEDYKEERDGREETEKKEL